MTFELAITWFGLATGAGFVLYGLWYFVQPIKALHTAHHREDKLPLVMGTRYAFFGALLISALLYGDRLVLTGLLLGFTWLGGADTFIYRKLNPYPHATVAILCAAAALYFFATR